MQPDNSSESIATIKDLESTSKYRFGLTLSGPHIMPIIFNSHSNLDHERKVTIRLSCSIACGRWAISRLRKYLWKTFFYCLEYNVVFISLKDGLENF